MIISEKQYNKLPERLQKCFYKGNFHVAVKPLKLMSYLITLGCPPNGVILDPFLGSGTTMLAARLMSKNCIGIEINSEYCAIAKARAFTESPLDPNKYCFEVFGAE